jgi:hypothetical protein
MNFKPKQIVASFIVGIMVAGCGTALAGSSSNDRVQNESQYTEVFKDEGGGKNYRYTVDYQIDAPQPGKCVVATANSEQAIAIHCNDGTR